MAGIISFAANMILAAILVRPLRGAGIALALSLASAINTVLLLVFLKKNPHIAVGRALRSALVYTLKLAVLSGIAVIPVLFLAPRLLALFAGRGRLVSYGIPLAVNAAVYALAGIVLLLLTKDRQLQSLIAIMRLKTSRNKESA